MRKKTILTLISALVLSLTPIVTNGHSKNKLSDTTKVETTTKQSKTILKGNATFYGYNYTSTKKTASGEKFNKNALTAAHKTLPFGTKVKVTNLKNNKTVIVKINDRGPFGKNRIIDLSVAAAKKLSMIDSGVVPVKLEILK